MKAVTVSNIIFLVLVTMSLLFSPTTALVLPKSSPKQRPSSDSEEHLATDVSTVTTTMMPSIRTLHQRSKRHDYTLICGTTDGNGVTHDDIPLSRRCLSEPYKYRCDKNGQPDITEGGRTLEECDRKCDCKDVSTDHKPRCIRLGAGSADGYYMCW